MFNFPFSYCPCLVYISRFYRPPKKEMANIPPFLVSEGVVEDSNDMLLESLELASKIM